MLQTYLNKTPFLRFLLPFVAGITASVLFNINIETHWYLLAIHLLAIPYFFLLLKKWKTKFFFGLLLNAFFFVLGVESCYLRKANNNLQHYSHFIESKEQKYIAVISDIPQLKERSIKCRIQILQQEIKGKLFPANGEMILYLERTDSSALPQYGNKLIFEGMPQVIAEPKNPFEFNYKSYLLHKNIFHQLYLKKSNYIIDGNYESNALFDFAVNLKTDLLTTLKENGLTGNEYAITAALMLGYDDEISGDLMTAYSHTGTLHVLSVSGLHVGVLFLALTFLLRFPDKRIFLIIKTIIILCCLWFYALLSGLSPSVVRSTAMFSFVLFGIIINKKGQIYNSIFASAFMMLLFDPFLIIDTGFQLSYLAVVGIVFFYPMVYKWYMPPNKYVDIIWKMFAVSMSAQIITIPITLYYFHQFPLLFFIANMLVIPLSYVVMFGAVFIVLFSKIKFVASVLTFLVAKSVWVMNTFTIYLDQLKFSYVSGINTDFIDMVILFILLAFITYTLIHKNFITLAGSLILIIFMLCSGLLLSLNSAEDKKLLIFQFDKETKLGLIDGRTAGYYSDTLITGNTRSKQTIEGFNTGTSIKETRDTQLKDGLYKFTFAEKKWCWMIGGDLSAYKPADLECDYFIVSKNARVKKLEEVKALRIIADGSNNYKTINYLKKKCSSAPEKLWITKEAGAFIYE